MPNSKKDDDQSQWRNLSDHFGNDLSDYFSGTTPVDNAEELESLDIDDESGVDFLGDLPIVEDDTTVTAPEDVKTFNTLQSAKSDTGFDFADNDFADNDDNDFADIESDTGADKTALHDSSEPKINKKATSGRSSSVAKRPADDKQEIQSSVDPWAMLANTLGIVAPDNVQSTTEARTTQNQTSGSKHRSAESKQKVTSKPVAAPSRKTEQKMDKPKNTSAAGSSQPIPFGGFLNPESDSETVEPDQSTEILSGLFQATEPVEPRKQKMIDDTLDPIDLDSDDDIIDAFDDDFSEPVLDSMDELEVDDPEFLEFEVEDLYVDSDSENTSRQERQVSRNRNKSTEDREADRDNARRNERQPRAGRQPRTENQPRTGRQPRAERQPRTGRQPEAERQLEQDRQPGAEREPTTEREPQKDSGREQTRSRSRRERGRGRNKVENDNRGENLPNSESDPQPQKSRDQNQRRRPPVDKSVPVSEETAGEKKERPGQRRRNRSDDDGDINDKKFPTWNEAVSVIVDANIGQRKKSNRPFKKRKRD